MNNQAVLNHPLVQHHLSILRDKSTPPQLFRTQIHLISMLIAAEATKDLKLQECRIQTPIEETSGRKLSQRISIVPILRAGLGLVDPILQLLPEAEVWHLGMYRDEATALPVEYYCKLPKDSPADVGIVLDPMLATGGSIRVAIAALKRWGVPDIRVISVIASEDGIAALSAEYPDVTVFVGAIDPILNENKFIVPGLGDAGDRMFNTRHA
ncbi:MAG: uracil phosphoribosyltransferase [Pirellula sp.]|jgi:uracil phosphoribosyltransferase